MSTTTTASRTWALLAAGAFALMARLPAYAANTDPLAVGALAPSISEPTAKGTFDSSKSAKPFVVEFFAVWCPHCQHEVPVVNELESADGDRVDVIAIPASAFGFDHSSSLSQADIDRFSQQFNVKYPIGFDGFFSTAFDYGVAAYPTFYVVDASRHVVAVEAGEVPFDKLQADVLSALGH